MFAYLIYRAGSYFGRILPARVSDAIGWIIGQASCIVRRGTRRDVEANLQIIHGGTLSRQELRRMSHRVIMNFARSIVVFLKLPTYRWDDLRERADMSEFEAAIEGMGERPVFMLASIHMGPWELGGMCLSRLGFKIHTVALDHPSEQVTRFFNQRRSSIGVINHPIGNSYTVLKEALKNGDSVALLIDRAYGATHKRYDFLGVRAKLPLGHLFLSASTGAPILTGAMVFVDGGRFKYIHGGIHFPPREGTEDFDKLEGLQAECLKDFERIIREHSEQWFQFKPLVTPDPDGEDHGH
jgi:KDO2-lipid IV(A) lauroyltransferase